VAESIFGAGNSFICSRTAAILPASAKASGSGWAVPKTWPMMDSMSSTVMSSARPTKKLVGS